MIARSDVVGSLLRPSALVSARRAYEAGESGPAALKKAEDEAIDHAIAITAEEQRAKLELVGTVARSVWGEG